MDWQLLFDIAEETSVQQVVENLAIYCMNRHDEADDREQAVRWEARRRIVHKAGEELAGWPEG